MKESSPTYLFTVGKRQKNKSWFVQLHTFFRYQDSASSLFLRTMPSYWTLSSAKMAPRSGLWAASTSTFTCSLSKRAFREFISCRHLKKEWREKVDALVITEIFWCPPTSTSSGFTTLSTAFWYRHWANKKKLCAKRAAILNENH